MDNNELVHRPITELASRIRSGALSPVRLAEAYLHRIRTIEPTVNSFITVAEEECLTAAHAAERALDSGLDLGPLHGIPMAVKDLFHTAGMRTTFGTRIEANNVPQTDATVVRMLREAGAIIIGKTNLNEFAVGVTGQNAHYGDSLNPWSTDRMSGGSSGGSATAVVAGECAGALGSDTGGSVRIPAALCGIVGLKPTYGRVSLHGVHPLCPSLDHVGIMARTVADAALLLSVIAGPDQLDPLSVAEPTSNYLQALDNGIGLIRVGVPKEYIWQCLDQEVAKHTRAALETLARLGADISEVSLPTLADSQGVSTIILATEALTTLGGIMDAHGALLDPRVRDRLEGSRSITTQDLDRARQSRQQLTRSMADALQRYDVLVMPTCPIPAPRTDATEVDVAGESLSVLSALTRLTRHANLTGLPALTLPCGFSTDGLPSGLQIIGRPWDEATVLRVANAYEQATPWKSLVPSLGLPPTLGSEDNATPS